MRGRLRLTPGLCWFVLVSLGCGAHVPVSQEPTQAYASFEHHGVNPVVLTEEDREVEVATTIDGASVAIAGHYLRAGVWPPAAAIRVEDFIAATGRDDARANTLGVRMTLGPSPFRRGWHVLVLRVTPGAPGEAEVPRVVLSDGDGLLERMFAGRGVPLAKGDLRDVLSRSEAQVIVVGTGGGLGGPSAQRELLAALARRRSEGRTLSVVGRLEGGLDDGLLDAAARVGGGRYEVLEPGREAALVDKMLTPISGAASVSFSFDGVRRWRLVGHEATSDGPFSRAAPEGPWVPGECHRFVIEVELAGGSPAIGTWTLRTRGRDRREHELGPTLIQAAPVDSDHRRTVLWAALGEKLRGSYWMKDVELAQLRREADELDGVDEIESMLASMLVAESGGSGVGPRKTVSPLP